MNAQYGHITDQTDDTTLTVNSFSQIDTSHWITSGILYDKMDPTINLKKFDGSVNSPIFPFKDFSQLWMNLRSGYIDSTMFPSFDSLFNQYLAFRNFHDAIPIIAYGLSFESFLPYSIDSGLVNLTNGTLSLNKSLISSPFQKKVFWNVGVGFNNLKVKDTVSFILPLEFMFSNLKGIDSINNISIDFDDGNGFVQLVINSKTDVYYSTEGDKIINIRFTDNKGDFFYAKTNVVVNTNKQNCYPFPSHAPWPDDLIIINDPSTNNPIQVPVDFMLKSNRAYNTIYGFGKVYVKYHEGYDPQNPMFKKPLIFIEGLDFGEVPGMGAFSYSKLKTTIKLGSAGWPTLWGCDDKYKLQNAEPVLEELVEEGYDIIMLDFYDGDTYIQRNAYLLEELINRVNQYKEGNEQIVLVGASMGGQVARYALTEMESQGIDHCVRLFCSFDSPWYGANIPLGLQAFLHYFAYDGMSSGARTKLNQLRSPAPKQLLKYHIDKAMYLYSSTSASGQIIDVEIDFLDPKNGAADLFHSFQNEITQLGHHPKNSRNIAIVNGNNNGNKIFANGAQFLHYDTDCVKFDQKANIYAGTTSRSLVADLNTGSLLKGIWTKRFFVSNYNGADNSPGSKREDFTELADEISDAVSDNGCDHNPLVKQASFSFIPSTSALALRNVPIDYPIQFVNENSSFSTGLTFMDAYFSISNPEDHVYASVDNMQWLKRQILLGEDVLENQAGLLTTQWNNPLENKHLSGLEIGNGGHLYLNANQPHYDEQLVPNNLNVPYRDEVSRVFLGSNCSGNNQLSVSPGGIFELGESYTYDGKPHLNMAELTLLEGSEVIVNGGELRINRDSKIIVKNGATLRINENSVVDLVDKAQIVIEDGGEFILEKNTTINLGHYESIIQFEGKVSILEDATLSFTGNGKLVFNQEIGEFDVYHNWYQPFDKYWFFGPNAKIELEGTSPNDIVLEVHKDMHPKMEDFTKPSNFNITDGKVVIAEGVKLQLGCPTHLFNAKVDSEDPQKLHGGVHFWGQPSIILKNTDFQHGEVAVNFNNISSSYSPFISNCNFESNSIGIRSIGKGINVSGCTFKFNDYGIEEENTSISSMISECLFEQNNIGLSVTGQTGFNLRIHDCEFKDNTGRGVYTRSVEGCKISCSTFESNPIGVEGSLSIIDISDHSNNVFQDNEVGVFIHGSNKKLCGIFLKDGFNIFDLGTYSNGLYIKGIVANGLPGSQYFGADIDADNNAMPLITLPPEPNGLCCGQAMPVDIVYTSGSTGSPWANLQLHIPNNLTSIPSGCNSGIQVELEPYEVNDVGNFSGRILYDNEYYPSGLTMNEIVITAGQNLSSSPENILNDEYSFYLLKSMLEANITNKTSDEKEILRLGYSLIKKAYSNLQRYNSEVINYTTQSQDQYIGFIQSYASERIQELPKNNLTNEEYQSKFQYSLDKAQLYRTGDYYSDALIELQNTASFSSGIEFLRSQYWTCVCTSESDYVSGVINPEEFSYSLDQCKLQFPTASYKNAGNGGANVDFNGYLVNHPNRSLSILNLYPNPTTKGFTLTLSNSSELPITVTLHDVLGVEVFREVFIPEGGSINVGDLALSPGTYLVKLHNNAGEIEHETTTLMVL